MSAPRKFHRAVLVLTEVVSTTNQNGYVHEADALRVAEVTVTGDTAADALGQLEVHVDALAEWHTQLEREQEDVSVVPARVLVERDDPDVVDVDVPAWSVECRHGECGGCDGTASEPGSPRCEHHCHKPDDQEVPTDGR
ncbi:hypothetical protein [Micromonospora sp. 4G55]|uniref:hypothetical protein n=1 Tax=Micromonospora sp. 4G55 TaxID=2806102 RepID=UPI001A453840|nr:hypothetical protein [Micromonospora sp. 4G55]MBM0256366.1 hypothetical protein [Micromonospora sp. 4G55]